MAMKTFTKLLLLIAGIVIVIYSCKKENEEPDPPQQTLTVNLGNDTSFVEGSSIILDAENPGAIYLWSTGETTQSISVNTDGKYWVSVQLGEAKGSDTIAIQVQFKTIKVETDFGDFRIWLYPETPLHRNNFLTLTDQGFYDSLLFHRVVYNFVIQGGDPEGTGYGGPGYEIPAEIIDTMHHRYGAVGAARQADEYNPERKSNGSQFYIVSDPDGQSNLNALYTVFGYVFSGIDAVFNISQVEVDDNGRPVNDVFMKKLTIELYTREELKNDFGFIIP